MSIRNNATRADVFFAFDNIQKEVAVNITPPTSPDLLKDGTGHHTRERLRRWLISPFAADLLDTLDRLKAAFHPNLMLEQPYPEWVLSHYPTRREFFHGPDTLMMDTMNSDAERAARASNDNRSQISHLRMRFSTLMTELSKEENRREKTKIIAELVALGHEWCIFEARITAVNQWYQMMWEPPCF